MIVGPGRTGLSMLKGMNLPENETRPVVDDSSELATRIHRWVTLLFTVLMLGEFVALVSEGERLSAFLVLVIVAMTVAPLIFRHRWPVRVPAEFQLLAVIFMFSALFLGEIRHFYDRFWWWDIALHGNSGLLLGIVGFLLVYVLNESKPVNLSLAPRFVAAFAFLFAVAIGTFWEIFEFAMDQLFGMEMQKAMLGDATGLTDTMWDLIVDTAGATVISLVGWLYLERDERSFIEAWIRKFIHANPKLFRKTRFNRQ